MSAQGGAAVALATRGGRRVLRGPARARPGAPDTDAPETGPPGSAGAQAHGSETGAPGPMAGPGLAPLPPRARPNRPNWWAILSFAVLVLLPLTVVGTYYAQTAADQYVAEARFTVREAETRALRFENAEAAPDRIGSGLATETVSQFTHVVASYLASPALLADLEGDMDVRAMFRRPEADPWARLPDELAFEAVYEYWQGRVRVAVDGPSGIVTLRLRAFAPEDALALSEAALSHAERLVNALSARQKRDQIARAEAEAAESERRLQASIAELAAFRDRERLIDPEQEGAETVRLMSQLEAERIRLVGEIEVLGAVVNSDAARARALRTRLDAITGDIARLRDGLAADATADGNIAAALARFEELEIRRRFAARLYGLAQTRLINAEIEAARQSIYLNLFDPPQMPEEARYPRRLAFTAIAAIVLVAAWATFALIWASVADHRLDRR